MLVAVNKCTHPDGCNKSATSQKLNALCTMHKSRLHRTGTLGPGFSTNASSKDRTNISFRDTLISSRRSNKYSDYNSGELLELLMYSDDKENCVEWPRGLDPDGYPDIRSNGKNIRGHRLAIQLYLGRYLIDEEQVLHSCDNPKCINIHHLRVGTTQENSQDRVYRNRAARRLLIQDDEALSILWDHRHGVKPKELVKKYGYKLSAIENIIYVRRFK